jgi:predicted NodU family carbamoyl transferase
MKIVGINTSHDSSVAQITDDTVDFVLDEPRFRRDKWWCPLEENSSNQYVSIDHKQITDVDHLIFASYDRRCVGILLGDELRKNANAQRDFCVEMQSAPMDQDRFDWLEDDPKFDLEFEWVTEGDLDINKEICEGQFDGMEYHFDPDQHHLYHAVCAHHLSPYKDEDCISIVWDGGGGMRLWDTHPNYQEMESIYYCTPDTQPTLQWQRLSNHRHLMNWGNDFPNFQYDCLICWGDQEIKDGDADIVISSRPSSGMNFSNLSKVFGTDPQGRGAGKIMGMASYGTVRFNVFNQYTVAQQCEEESFMDACGIIRDAITRNPDCKNIVLSGGYSLNCTNNYRYLKEFPDHQFFVDPIPHDGGTALGAALWLKRDLTS